MAVELARVLLGEGRVAVALPVASDAPERLERPGYA